MEEERSPKRFRAHPERDSTMEAETETPPDGDSTTKTEMETPPDGDSTEVCVIFLKEPNSSFLSTHKEFETNA